MSEPTNPPPEDVSGRHAADTGPAGADPGAVGGAGGAGGEPEPEPPVSLTPPGARPTPPPLEADTVRILAVGIVVWFAGFLVLLPLRSRLAADGHELWLWTCLAGGVLGLIGLPLAVRARARRN